MCALDVCLRQGAIQIHVYLTLPWAMGLGVSLCVDRWSVPSLFAFTGRLWYGPLHNSMHRLCLHGFSDAVCTNIWLTSCSHCPLYPLWKRSRSFNTVTVLTVTH